jgi:hypothetical protein
MPRRQQLEHDMPNDPIDRQRRRAGAWLALSLLTPALSGCGGTEDDTARSGPNHELKPGAHAFDAGSAELLEQDDDTIALKGGGAADVRVGDVIVSTLGDGALRRVTGIQALPGGAYRFATEQAALIDAFKRFDLRWSKPLDASDLGTSFDTGEPGLTLRWSGAQASGAAPDRRRALASVDGPSLTLEYKKWEVSAGSGIEVTGSARFALQPEFHVALVDVPGHIVPALTYRAALSPAYSHEITVSSEYGGTLAVKQDREIKLKPIVIASPPVTIVPYLVVSASAGGTAAGAFSTTHTASINGSAYVERRADASGDVGHSFQPLMQGRFDSAEAALAAKLVPIELGLEFRIYNVGGPQFAVSAVGTAEGSYAKDGVTGIEGIRAKLSGELQFTAAVGGHIGFLKKLFSDFSGSFTLVSKDFTLWDLPLADAFFPFKGAGSVRVYDNGNATDDIFEVSLDGAVLGRTAKGGSGQFRLGSLRPGSHTLRLLTIEDDDPPGTWAVSLSNGVRFADGTTERAGQLALGQSLSLAIVVPDPS